MPIVTATLFNQLDPVQARLRELFEQAGCAPNAPLPPPRVYETADAYVLEIRVPKNVTGPGSCPRGSSLFGRGSTGHGR